VSLIILIAWDKVPFKLKLIPGALIAVISGIVLNEILLSGSSLAISNAHLVTLPVPTSFDELKAIVITPNFSGF
jgi:hypothetical protein